MPRGRKLIQFTEPTIAVVLSEAQVLAKADELARLLSECVVTRTEQQPAQLELGADREKAAKSKAH